MRLEFPHHPEWEVPLHPAIHSILQQKFSYLAKGAQCYVFESEDRQFVIKFFRYDQPPVEEKVMTLFNACKLAYDRLRDETALLYIHLNPTQEKWPLLRCTDPVGRTIRIPLDQARFAIQKKGERFFDCFEKALSDRVAMKRQIDSFIDLLFSRASKGVLNTDRSLGTNFGFIDGQAVEFDFGNYRSVPDLKAKGEVIRYTSQLKEWLSKSAPEEWSSYLNERMEAME